MTEKKRKVTKKEKSQEQEVPAPVAPEDVSTSEDYNAGFQGEIELLSKIKPDERLPARLVNLAYQLRQQAGKDPENLGPNESLFLQIYDRRLKVRSVLYEKTTRETYGLQESTQSESGGVAMAAASAEAFKASGALATTSQGVLVEALKNLGAANKLTSEAWKPVLDIVVDALKQSYKSNETLLRVLGKVEKILDKKNKKHEDAVTSLEDRIKDLKSELESQIAKGATDDEGEILSAQTVDQLLKVGQLGAEFMRLKNASSAG